MGFGVFRNAACFANDHVTVTTCLDLVKVDVKEDGRDTVVSKVIILASFTIGNQIHFTIMYYVKSFFFKDNFLCN